MPLRDHFHSPTLDIATWEEFHAMWPTDMVRQLKKLLPEGYVSAPRVHLGQTAEVDVAAFDQGNGFTQAQAADQGGGVVTLPWAPPVPSVVVETELPDDDDEYQVRIYDAKRHRLLVATIEIVSPGNKDRPAKRSAFVNKCAGLLRSGVAVSIVDVVTERQSNLYAELMDLLGHPDPQFIASRPSIYAASIRWRPKNARALLETWTHTLNIGSPLPILPLWLTESLVVPLDLEQSYEQACSDLSIP